MFWHFIFPIFMRFRKTRYALRYILCNVTTMAYIKVIASKN